MINQRDITYFHKRYDHFFVFWMVVFTQTLIPYGKNLFSNIQHLTSNLLPLTHQFRFLAIFSLIMGLGSLPTAAQPLEDYFTTAAENNPGLQGKYKDFEAAMERVPQVSSLDDPTLSFGYFISPVETRLGPQNAKFSLSQMFPWFGTLKAREDAAALAAEAKYQEFLDTRNELYYEVARAYYPLYKLKQWKAIEQENIEILESYKNIATRNLENGKSSMVDVLRVDIMLKDATTNLKILKDKEKPLRTRFNKLLDRPSDEPVEIQDPEKPGSLPADISRDSLMARHPRLKKLELLRESGEASETAARKSGYPKLGFGLDYVAVGERTDMNVDNSGRDVIMPMVSISIPIFRKKYNAAVKEARLKQERYALQKEEVANNLVSEYENAWFTISEQYDLIELYDEQINETQQALKLISTAYANSGNDFEELLRMQQERLKYEKKKAKALAEYKTAIARMEYLKGM